MALERTPTLGGFVLFVRNVMGISASVLPDSSPSLQYAYDLALETTNRLIACASAPLYVQAIYNLGGDNLINYAQDTPNAPAVQGSDPPMAYFAFARKQFNVGGFVSGVIQSAGDDGTSESMVVQKAAEDFTLSDLQNLKTPWGRQYLAITQKLGTQWGLS